MKNISSFIALLSVYILLSFSYRTTERPGPHAIIYKTKADYTEYVPVTLSDDKTRIVSYPSPQDIYYKGKLATPTRLSCGFLLDNRGITAHSAFIKISYEDYAKLKDAPSEEELYKLIIDKNPFTEMYDLGVRTAFQNEAKEIGTVIKKHKLKSYQKLI